MSPRIALPAESDLVLWLKGRDERGLRVLYDHYSAALYGVIFRIVNDRETAEDVLQETFIKIWNNASAYDVGKGRLYTWMLNIARNSAIDKVRSKDFRDAGQVQSIDEFVYSIERQHQHATAIDHIGLKKLVEQLKPEQQQLVDLLYFGGYTQTEAAEALNIPLGTVKTRIKAALTRLRQMMNG
jgi:RNA polymerase sigma-70 factor, ECF subfamily